ncbi:MAG: Peptidase family [Bacteroidetes bacterium]|nr:Peptidase family [Bacteroidota bacterium]
MRATTFLLFIVGLLITLFACRHKPVTQTTHLKKEWADTIFIQPFYPVTDVFAQIASRELHDFYGSPIVILPTIKIYEKAHSATGRYSAPILLNCLSDLPRAKGYKILGLASFDIFTESRGVKEWGIFGLGNCPGNACVVSDFRLKQFKGKTEAFTINVIIHEIGHNFGLPHCDKDEKCLMNDAKGTIATLYKEQKWLCPYCTNKLAVIRAETIREKLTAWLD